MATRFTQEHLDRLQRGERRPGTERFSPAEGRRLLSGLPASNPAPEHQGSKHRNVPTNYNGHHYDSKAEANYARGLDFKQLGGLVTSWEPHVKFELRVNDVLIGTYELDFRVHYADGHVEHIDVKGQRSTSSVPYKLFLLKKRLMKAIFGIDVLEVKG